MKFIDSFLDRLLAVLFAFLFAQAPAFFLQYTHRLAGHVEELKLLVAKVQDTAASVGKSLPEHIYKLTHHPDVEIVAHGELLQETLTRFQELSHALFALQGSTSLTRPFVFLSQLKTDIAYGTWGEFQLSVPLTVEALIYACVGVVVGVSLYQGVRKFCKTIWQWCAVK